MGGGSNATTQVITQMLLNKLQPSAPAPAPAPVQVGEKDPPPPDYDSKTCTVHSMFCGECQKWRAALINKDEY